MASARSGGPGSRPRILPAVPAAVVQLRILAEEQRPPGRATACWPSLGCAAELGLRGRGPASGGGLMSNQDCQGVRIYASDQCPRQDSNLRSRLRRPVLFTAASRQNARWRHRWGAYGGCAVGGWFGAEVPWCFRVTASMAPAVGRLAGAY